MAHGFLAYQDARHNKGYTEAFNKFAWNQSKTIGKALYQKLKDELKAKDLLDLFCDCWGCILKG